MQQKAHRWPQSAQLHPEQPGRRAERHRSLDGPPSLSAVSPFTVIGAYRRFLFSQEWIVGDNLLQPYWLTAQKKKKAGLESRLLLLLWLKIQPLAFLSPQPCWSTHAERHHQRKKEKRGGKGGYRKGKTALTSAAPQHMTNPTDSEKSIKKSTLHAKVSNWSYNFSMSFLELVRRIKAKVAKSFKKIINNTNKKA